MKIEERISMLGTLTLGNLQNEKKGDGTEKQGEGRRQENTVEYFHVHLAGVIHGNLQGQQVYFPSLITIT